VPAGEAVAPPVCETDGMYRRATAIGLILGQLVLATSGCMSVRAAGTRESRGAGGGVAVTVFANDSARRANTPGPTGVLGELQRHEGDRWVTVFRSLDPSWAVAGLPPGGYRVRFPARLDDAGDIVRLSGDAKSVTVQEGRITDVHAILEHVPTALVVVGVVTVVVAAVLISKYLSDHDLPAPPPPPPELVEAMFYISIDLASGPEWQGVGDRQPPQVTSHFPASGALVAVRRPKVILAISEPLRSGEVETKAVSVLGEASGLIPGIVSYDAQQWWIVWEPQQDLPGGDTFHVTLAADAAEDLSGNELAAPASFAFRTAR